MTPPNARTLLAGAALVGLIFGGWACVQGPDLTNLEGTWDCKSEWTWDKDGEAVPCSAVWTVTSKDHKTTSTGIVSLGAAQWDETIEGIGRASGYDLHHTRTAHKATPRNDAARDFERDLLDGRSLGTLGAQGPSHMRIITLTDTDLVVINEEERTITCKRP